MLKPWELPLLAGASVGGAQSCIAIGNLSRSLQLSWVLFEGVQDRT
jgi:hypothetical protein